MNIETRFGSRNAAEVWDAQFRWREAGRLRDVTVDDTWQRVAEAIATNGGGMEASSRARAYARAFACWKLLPAAELLATAGTASKLDRVQEPHAIVNCAAFVTGGTPDAARVDWAGFDQAARLALWLLDDAAGSGKGSPCKAGLGLIGAGAALARLGFAYDSAEARSLVARFALCLSVAVAESSIQLAVERGPRLPVAGATPDRWRSLGLSPDWLAAAKKQGLRQDVSIGVARVPALARLADTSDALDPGGSGWISDAEAGQGMALAEAAMYRAVQPWIDDPLQAVR